MPAGGRRDGPARWGYHRLADSWARRLVASAGVEPGDLVLDVGAGTGALTTPLVAAGARVVAVELHARRADALRHRFAGAPVTVVRADAADLRLPRRPFRVVANPPFGVATGLVRRLLSPGSRLLAADLVVPRHIAQRWTGPGAPGAQRWALTFVARTSVALPPGAFRPRARAHAVVLRLERHA